MKKKNKYLFYNKRSMIAINSVILETLKNKAFNKGLTTNINHAKQIIDILQKCFIEGLFDKELSNIGTLRKTIIGSRTPIQCDTFLKMNFGERAFDMKLITKPIHSAFLIEVLIDMFNKNKTVFNIVKKEYYEWKKSRNNKWEEYEYKNYNGATESPF